MKMYIKEVRINNYKTYKNARIKFHPQLNIIVGPNGSGKSNLIEAILYGLGERSMKIFRAYKYRDLLPADSGSSAKILSVTLIIEDEQGNEHIFKRVYNARNNTHSYYYNRRRVGRGVYISKLATLGFKGFHHVYIPQGGVISKANITSRDLKDIVDEALGIKEFNIKKQEALEKLEKAEAKLENIKEKQEIMRDIINRLMNQMVAYGRKRNINNMNRRLKAYILAKENKDLEPRLAKYNEKLRKVIDTQEKLSNRMQKIEEKISRVDTKTKRLREKLRERGEYHDLLSNYSNTKMNIELAKERIKRLETDKEGLLKELNNIDEEIKNIREEVSVYTETLKEITQTNRKMNSELKGLYRDREKLEKKQAEYRRELEYKILEKKRLDKEKIDIIKKEIEMEAERIAIKKIRNIYLDKKREMEDKRRKYVETIGKFEERITKLNTRKEELENKLKKLREEKKKIEARHNEIKRELKDAEKLLSKVEKYVEKLRKEEEVRNIVTKNNVEYIMKVARDMNLKGIIGVLNELIEGPPEIINILNKYMGREWYSIIVYDESTARKLFKLSESLKKKVIIKPLTKYMNIDIKLHERSVINILKIKHQRKLKPLVTALFGNLVLTSDIDEGMKLLEKGYGIISKRGDFIITPDNWIYEGRRKIVIDEDISKIEEVYNQFRKMIRIRRGDLEKYGEKRERIIEEISDLTSEYNRLKQSIDLIKTSIGYMKDLERFYRRKIKEIETDLNKSREKKSKAKAPTTKLVKIDDEINRIHAAINENIKLLEEINRKISEVINIINKNDANIELIKKSILSIKNKKVRLRERKIEIRNKIKEIDMNIRELKSYIKTTEKEKDELEKQIEKFSEEIRRIEDKIEKLNGLKNELYNKWKKANERLSELRRIETKLNYKIRSIRNRIRDNEETVLKLGYVTKDLMVDNIEVNKLIEALRETEEEEDEINKDVYYPSPTAYIEYKEKYEPYKLFTINKAKLEEEKEAILRFIQEIEEEKEKTFMDGFREIREKFTKLINHVFPESEVYMDLEDPDDIDSGLAVYVRLKDKPQLPIISTSGGEKSLFIILFLLAVYSIPGNVVFLLDEIDAHIDPRNLNKFASALGLQKKESQIIYVTLPRDESLPRISDHLIGIFFRRGISRPVVIPNIELFRVIK